MSTQNQTTKAYGKSRNLFIQSVGMTLEEIQKVIEEKIAFIRKNNLLLGFKESSLATQLDINREKSKKLAYLEWTDISSDFIASQLVAEMESQEKSISQLVEQINKIREEGIAAKNVLRGYLVYKQSFIEESVNDEQL